MRNAHEILNVSPGVDPKTLRQVHRNLAKELHPDRNPDPKAGEKMAIINAAYDHIKDTQNAMNAQPEYTTGAARTRDMDEVMSQLRAKMNRQNPKEAAEKANRDAELQDKQRRSIFGAPKATRAAQEQADKDAAEKERQTRAWSQEQDIVTARRMSGQDDITQAQKIAEQSGSNDQKDFLRNLRNLRQARNNGQPMPENVAETTAAPVQPERPRIVPRRPTITARPTARPTPKNVNKPSIVRESPVSTRMNTAMDEQLDKLESQEAKLNLMARRQGQQRETAGLHKAQKIAIDNKGGLHIYMGSPAKEGQNYVVAPTFTTKDNTLTLGQPKIVGLKMDSQGAGQSADMSKSLISGGNRNVTFHFSEERENLRQTSQKRDTEQR